MHLISARWPLHGKMCIVETFVRQGTPHPFVTGVTDVFFFFFFERGTCLSADSADDSGGGAASLLLHKYTKTFSQTQIRQQIIPKKGCSLSCAGY